MASFNQVAGYFQGYIQSVGQQGGIIAGITGLSLKGSTSLADACTDMNGNIYATDPINHIVLKITESGNIYVIGGLSGVSGNNLGNTVTSSASRFNYPTGITCDKNGDIYVCDTNNHQIRKISNDKVSLVAGAATPASGTADGVGHSARFNKPFAIDIDSSGNLYVADTFNHSVRKIVGGVVSTFAGLSGTSGNLPVWANMTTNEGISGTSARFNTPYGITVSYSGYVFVCDTQNHVVKRIDPAGRVRIFSGTGAYGRAIGNSKTCTFQDLKFSDMNKSDELYIIDYNEAGPSRLVMINREGASANVLDFNGVSEGKYVAAVACNPANHLVVIESNYIGYEYSSSSSNSSSSNSSSSNSSSESIGNVSTSSSSNSSSSNSSSSNSSSSYSSESSKSLSSESSKSLSSESSSSNSSSSESSSSLSSESSPSSSSLSSESSKSLSSESSKSLSSESSKSLSSESSSSSSSMQGCEPKYCASTFTTTAINGTYTWTGAYHNSKAIYNNGTYNLWYMASPYYQWAISATVGGGIGTWLSSKVTTDGCPDGNYDGETGIIVVGQC